MRLTLRVKVLSTPGVGSLSPMIENFLAYRILWFLRKYVWRRNLVMNSTISNKFFTKLLQKLFLVISLICNEADSFFCDNC